MSATLNQDDIRLLKSVFATKQDLVAMEKRQDAKYVTKNDLTGLEARIEKRFDDLDFSLIKYSKDIEARIGKVEDAVGISATN
ncbi:MAG: hypothetical protein UX80_C0009G0038 [Candidatus Amesbacteria bacterium GW2011_GWA2_47_11b]|uniref:Uncharacterized protein n=2 Tax=Candidatus Amesiibacteriota TaxID=1752730 RepID=A0A0G1SJ03_9BACT|nr:MAG: hypothetical protein UX42_C0006G0022 [Microgenomates group bacterium GW2011_GWC1_46_20]KKU57823.1 MAG: hypothetical protein UX80_C0009G0038 [Candidatus Amesbacteria bacterium GW2011_GWA2_47_11b]KKU69401.1 MAG: hypothetical protein UX92_C0013G0006 [Candidatus Amesbacteria bacterium GW2011_GWA1_47_20]